jgi:hypothetical protein
MASRPSSVHSACRRARWLSCLSSHLERGDHGLVAFDDEHALRGVTPEAVRMREMRDELRGRFADHFRLRAGFEVFVHETPHATMTGDVLHAGGLDGSTEETAGLHPISFLNDAAIRIDDVEAAIGAGGHVQRAEIRIAAADELAHLLLIRIRDGGDAIFDLDRGAADETTDGLRQEDVAIKLLRQAITAIDGLAGATGEVVQALVLRRMEASGPPWKSPSPTMGHTVSNFSLFCCFTLIAA